MSYTNIFRVTFEDSNGRDCGTRTFKEITEGNAWLIIRDRGT
jgi:hypothetical protein